MAQKKQGSGSEDPTGRSMDRDRQQQGEPSGIINQPQQTTGGTGRDRNSDRTKHTDARDSAVDDDVREVNLSGPTQTK